MLDAQDPQRKTIRDARGREYVLQTLLGRGSFGKVYKAEDETSGDVVAAKLPLGDEDSPKDPPGQEMEELYGRLVREKAAQLKKLPPDVTLRAFGVVDGGGAVPCLLLEYCETSLLERLQKGMSFADLCSTLAQVCRALERVHLAGQSHGNLKPGNIFFVSDEDGTVRVKLSDPLTPYYHEHLSELETRHRGVVGWLPPEMSDPGVTFPLPAVVDTFCIAKLLYEAVVQPETLKSSYSGSMVPFVGSISKQSINRFKSALTQRLHEGNSNPHVRDLLVRRATALMNRALSAETDPSPPYRFRSASEMAGRLLELQELFHPGFSQVGMLISDASRVDGSFLETEDVRFSISFRCHRGIDDIDLITCMTYIRDLVAQEKVREAGVEVVPRHDGNRFRFACRIPRLRPGEYLVRVAVSLKGSPGKPIHRDHIFTVLPDSSRDDTREPLDRKPRTGAGARKPVARDEISDELSGESRSPASGKTNGSNATRFGAVRAAATSGKLRTSAGGSGSKSPSAAGDARRPGSQSDERHSSPRPSPRARKKPSSRERRPSRERDRARPADRGGHAPDDLDAGRAGSEGGSSDMDDGPGTHLEGAGRRGSSAPRDRRRGPSMRSDSARAGASSREALEKGRGRRRESSVSESGRGREANDGARPSRYYSDARKTPGSDDEAFFRRGAFDPRQYMTLIVAGGVVLIGLIAVFLAMFL